MANPFSSGGGGTHFEARVVAFGLAATACEAAFRGLRAEFVSRVSTQRADFGEHLDDVICADLGRMERKHRFTSKQKRP
jgi:hypothetical protein